MLVPLAIRMLVPLAIRMLRTHVCTHPSPANPASLLAAATGMGLLGLCM